MKISPLDIRQKIFEKTLRGYNKEEVQAFLFTLSKEWERMQDEMKEVHAKLTIAERDVAKLREVEDSLYRTLKTAEQTKTNVLEQANKEAMLQMKETKLQGEAIINKTKTKAKATTENAEKISKDILDDMEMRLRTLAQHYNEVETLREQMIGEIKRVAETTLEKVQNMLNNTTTYDLHHILNQAKAEKETLLTNLKYENTEHNKSDLASRLTKEDDCNTDTDDTSQSFFEKI